MEVRKLNTPSRYKIRSQELNYTGLGKLPPQARELEEAILGAIMLEKSAFDTVIEILKPECFYVEANQLIFVAMRSLADKSMPIDLLTVVEELKVQNNLEVVGGPYYVTKLTNAVVSAANIEAHSRIVVQKFIQRELIRVSGEMIQEAFEDSTDVFDLMDSAEGKLFEITNNHLRKNIDDISQVLTKTWQRIEELRGRNEDVTGVHTGFPTLDKVTGGWQNSDLIILAARPSVGKTAFALNLARAAALDPNRQTPVAFFSLEMGATQLVSRILAAEAEVELGNITRGKLQDYEMTQLMTKGVNKLMKAPMFIDDSPGLNIFDLRAKARRLKNKYNLGLIIIDYLQLMSGIGDRGMNREQEISKISRDLKGLAKELDIPIIALSQLSREVERRTTTNKMPQLSDLRESGAIEQDADMVMFLYRPEYHEINQNEQGESTKGQTFLRIAKHRNGSLETLEFMARLNIQKFEENKEGSLPPNLRRINPAGEVDGGESEVFIQKGSRMNRQDFEADFDGF